MRQQRCLLCRVGVGNRGERRDQTDDRAEKATLLSGSISIAMNTTAFGLMVAIPLLLIHSMLRSKTSAIIESLEIAVVKFLNLIEESPKAQAAPRAAKPEA